jgi:hypothetical protein
MRRQVADVWPLSCQRRFAGSAADQTFGLRLQLPDSLVELYKGFKNDLPLFNDDPSWTLQMPACYVIDQG